MTEPTPDPNAGGRASSGADERPAGGAETPPEGLGTPPGAPQAVGRSNEDSQPPSSDEDAAGSASDRSGPSGSDESGEPDASVQLAERTADLQRLQAEYINYKRRVERDRELMRGYGVDAVLRSLLPVLDDIGRADQHGELTGGFKAVSDSLSEAVRSHSLESFGEVGEPFDPRLHEAVAHSGSSPDVTVESIDAVMQRGYRVGDRILRAAVVAVVDPEGDPVAANTVDDDDIDGERSSGPGGTSAE